MVPAILGLDPAKVLFSVENSVNRLRIGDASYVEIIHTSTDIFGFRAPIGDCDIYVNGDSNQEKCRVLGYDWKGTCSHSFAVEVANNSLDQNLTARRCRDIVSMERGIVLKEELTVGSLQIAEKKGRSGIFLLTANL